MSKQPLSFQPEHDHDHCIHEALKKARGLCAERKQRLTPIRELVLQLIWKSHKPLGAYELLPALADAGFNSAPPTVYRALDFLQTQGLVHRISSLNAFIGCPHPGPSHQGCFLICRACNSTVELESAPVQNAIHNSAAHLGFIIEQETVEVVGLCPNCQSNDASPAQREPE